MSGTFEIFLTLSEQDKRDVFEASASRLDTLPSYVEKDFWVCLVLDMLYNRLPAGHPKLLFKGGTSLSKAFGLIQRFSEDI
ncbi:MAG: nucleotidyl transferase AbiEii/AbiGii toxin family protein, partial [Boseongicola sp.]|nr:nucleotidyl transferase AbiEii/AbiGii toxin family protein [Boseongicola sp.]